MGALKALLVEYAEDVSLLLGAVLLSVGAGLVLGAGYALMVLGTLLVSYGVWVSPRKVK
jgi:hypothetical protein